MSYTAEELFGVCGMMPAFSTKDAGDMNATETVDVDNLADGLDRVIKDGVHVIATTGTFGQVWDLLWDEWKALVTASIETVNDRVPLMLGCTSPNPRDVVQKMKFIRDAGGQGVLLGVPYYYELPDRDVASFYRHISEMFPDISIMIYHNPENHKKHIPVRVFNELVKLPNIVAMKDSHRETREFLALHRIIHGKISHFVNQVMLYPYFDMGASGCWSHAIWSGPWPVLALWNAAAAGDREKQMSILADLQGGGGGGDAGEGGGRSGHLHHEFSGYIDIGPPRPPFSWVLEKEEDEAKNIERGKRQSDRWLALCEKYRPEVEAAGVTQLVGQYA